MTFCTRLVHSSGRGGFPVADSTCRLLATYDSTADKLSAPTQAHSIQVERYGVVQVVVIHALLVPKGSFSRSITTKGSSTILHIHTRSDRIVRPEFFKTPQYRHRICSTRRNHTFGFYGHINLKFSADSTTIKWSPVRLNIRVNPHKEILNNYHITGTYIIRQSGVE